MRCDPSLINAASPFREVDHAARVRSSDACRCLVGFAIGNATELRAQTAQVERGKYLVVLGGCTDCHTPGFFFGKPDMARYLGGSEVGFEIPGLGVFHGPNLTPDPDTGLGKWSADQIVAALQTGKRPDGREVCADHAVAGPGGATEEDVYAIAAFLQSIPAVNNKVAGPFGPSQKPTSFVMKIVPPEGTGAKQ